MSITSDLRTQALKVAAALQPDTMTPDAAMTAVAELATVEKAAATARMFVALRVARTDAWRGQGHLSAADWLAAQIGVTVPEAARQLGTAKRADKLPNTKNAMRKGRLSPSQADAVTDGATADPNAEDDLLDAAANDTNKTLRDKANKAKAAATDTRERERRITAKRSLRRGTDADGAWWLHLYGPATDAARFEELLRPFEELIFQHHRRGGVHSTHDNRSFDALIALLTHLSTQPTEPPTDTPADQVDAPGDDDTAPPPKPTTKPPAPAPAPAPAAAPNTGAVWTPPWDPDHPITLPNKPPGGNNTKVIVLIDHTALLRGHTLSGETCEIAGIGPVSVHAVRDILRNDPFLAVVVRKGRDVINVAHHGRGLNAHQRTAIEATGLRCTNIACNHTIAIQIDHRTPYAQDPTTALPNQDPLCPECHRRKTHHGWHLTPGTGPRPLLPPDAPSSKPATPDDEPATVDEPPTGQALLDLGRPLTKAEADAVERRLKRRLEEKGRTLHVRSRP